MNHDAPPLQQPDPTTKQRDTLDTRSAAKPRLRSTFKITLRSEDTREASPRIQVKTELLYWAGHEFATRAEAEATLLRYIDGWYNPRRIQQRLGGLAPDEYEEAWHRQDHSKGFVTAAGNEIPGGASVDPM